MKAEIRERLIGATSEVANKEIATIEEELATEDIDDVIREDREQKLGRVVEGFTSASEVLAAKRQKSAEALLVPVMLSAGHSSVAERIDQAITELGVTQTREFDLRLASWLSHRPTSVFARLGSRLNSEFLQSGAEAELGEILARFWHEAAEGSDQAREGFEQIAELRRNGAAVQLSRLEDEILESLTGSVGNEGEVEGQRYRFGLIQDLDRMGLIDPQSVADLLLAASERSLSEPPPPEQQEALAGLLEDEFAWGAQIASPARLEASRDALSQSPWIDSRAPIPETLRLRIEASLTEGESRPSSPFTSDEIGTLVRSHGAKFIPGLTVWLEAFRPQPAAVAKVMPPFYGAPLPAKLARAIDDYLEGLSPAGRYRLVRDLIAWPPMEYPFNERLLIQLGIRGADEERVAKDIIERFRDSSNAADRKKVMAIWRALAPRDDAVRRKLIKQVFIPLSGRGVGSYELCRKNLELCKEPPFGTKRELLDALANAPSRKAAAKMADRLRDVGLRRAKE